jgi:hypothetical protein
MTPTTDHAKRIKGVVSSKTRTRKPRTTGTTGSTRTPRSGPDQGTRTVAMVRTDTEDKLWQALHANPNSTAADLASAAQIGKSTAGKILAKWEKDGSVTRTPGIAEGGRRAADLWRFQKATPNPPRPPTCRTARRPTRTRPTPAPPSPSGVIRQHRSVKNNGTCSGRSRDRGAALLTYRKYFASSRPKSDGSSPLWPNAKLTPARNALLKSVYRGVTGRSFASRTVSSMAWRYGRPTPM